MIPLTNPWLKLRNHFSVVATNKVQSGDHAVQWLAREVGLSEADVKKALLVQRPNNSFTVDATEIFDELYEVAKPVIRTEIAMRAVARVGSAVALGVPLGIFVSSGATAAGLAGITAITFSPAIALAGVFATEPLNNRQKAARDAYRDKKDALRTTLSEQAEQFDRQHGRGDFEIAVTLKPRRRSVPTGFVSVLHYHRYDEVVFAPAPADKALGTAPVAP